MFNLRCLEIWLLSQRWRRPGAKRDSGLTLIECLVAIVVVALVVGLISPALVISVATRVNSQRTEQALEVAQAEIDKVRTIVERGGYAAADLPPSVTFTQNVNWETRTNTDGINYRIEYPETIPGPLDDGSALVASTTTYDAMTGFQARQVDIDGDGGPDLAVQAFRSPNSTAFSIGVRVYDLNAFNGGGNNLATDNARAGVMGSQGERDEKPLATIYTTIAKSDVDTSLCQYVEYLGSTPYSHPQYDCN